MFRRSLPLGVRSSNWFAGMVVIEGAPTFVRWRTNVPDGRDRAQLPSRTVVTIPIQEPRESGLPSGDENRLLNATEDVVIDAVDSVAMLVAVLTGDGRRRLVFQHAQGDRIHQRMDAVARSVRPYTLECTSVADPDWADYERISALPLTIPEGLGGS